MLEIAIDIGGTFTDVICLQDQQRLVLAKVPTTPQDLVQGVRQGVARVLELVGQPASAVERFIHSTTVATNAILEHKGSRPAYFDEYQAYCDTPVYARRCLPMGAQLRGPAILEQPDTTTVVYPGQHCQVDSAGNLVITVGERA